MMKNARRFFALLLVLITVATIAPVQAASYDFPIFTRMWTNEDMGKSKVTGTYKKIVEIYYSGDKIVEGTAGRFLNNDYCRLTPVEDKISACVGSQTGGASGLHWGNYAGPGLSARTSDATKGFGKPEQLWYGCAFYGTCHGYDYTPSWSTITLTFR